MSQFIKKLESKKNASVIDKKAEAALKRLVRKQFKKPEKEIDWGVLNLIPELYSDKNLLASAYAGFTTFSNIPIQLPIFTILTYVSAYLTKSDCKIKIPFERDFTYPNIWVVNLADSGGGKTLSKGIVQGLVPKDDEGREKVDTNFSEPAGAAGMLEELADKPQGFFFMDECAQVLKQIETPGTPLRETKKYFLEAYDGGKITRKTRGKVISVEGARLTMLWLNTIDSFIKSLDEISLKDGFSSRFLYCLGTADIDRVKEDHQQYNTEEISDLLAPHLENLFSMELWNVYEVPKDVNEYWKNAFSLISINHFNCSVEEGIYRRNMRSAYKYALLYHLILGKEECQLDMQDMEFGIKASLYHLYSFRKLMTYYTGGYEAQVEKAKRIVWRIKQIDDELTNKGKALTKRILQRRISAIKNSDMAEEYLRLYQANKHKLDIV